VAGEIADEMKFGGDLLFGAMQFGCQPQIGSGIIHPNTIDSIDEVPDEAEFGVWRPLGGYCMYSVMKYGWLDEFSWGHSYKAS
jgi:hypothetical protein